MFDRNGGRILANPVMSREKAAADAKRLLEERAARPRLTREQFLEALANTPPPRKP